MLVTIQDEEKADMVIELSEAGGRVTKDRYGVVGEVTDAELARRIRAMPHDAKLVVKKVGAPR